MSSSLPWNLSAELTKTQPRTSKPRVAYEACPLCGGTKFPGLKSADCTGHPTYDPIIPARINWVRCATCTHVFTDGYFSEEHFAAMFGRTLSVQQVGFELEIQRYVSARIIDRIARFVADGAWLDVGFGNGSLLFTAEEWGFEPVGLDLRAQNIADMKKRGIEAHAVVIEKLEQDGRFAVVSMADVLEHIPFPKPALVAARRLLKSDGLLFLSMPSYDAPVWRELDAQNANPYWMEIEHFHNFSRGRLYALLEEHGFKPIHFAVSERYRAGMEIISKKIDHS
jgi:2-polyprenyl-3-methyl-5-hydroxy-6-metoxy-1,4-benzoquinol methylase